MKNIEVSLDTSDSNIVIIISRFNNFINNNLLNGSINTLKRIGKIKDENITIIWVPGAYEIPLIAKKLAISKKYNAIITLATIIKGNSSHFKFVAKECSYGLSLISIETLIPITLGILITKNIEQAIERAGTKLGNKGSIRSSTCCIRND